MISITTIWAIVLRHIRMFKKDLNMMLGVFYWPFLDVLIWGFLGSWIGRSQVSELPHYEVAALLGLLLWQVVGRTSNIIALTLCEELWSYNIVNIFSLPISIIEWICSVLVYSSIMMLITALFCMGIIGTLYDVSMAYIFSTFLIFMPPLLLSAIWLGFTCLQIIILLGRRGTELGFVVGWFLMPFSGAFYPTDVLPQWAQSISACLPMSYVFKGMREYVMHKQDPTSYLIKGYVLGILYAAFSVALFIYCFNQSKQKGLARLGD